MKKTFRTVAASAAFLGVSGGAQAGLEETTPTPDILGWISGCWMKADGSIREVWSPSESGFYFGYAINYQNDRPVFFEQLRVETAPPSVTYYAYPAGRTAVAFGMIEQDDTFVLFENIENDFPQRIKYEVTADGISATISSVEETQSYRFDYIPCEVTAG